MKNSVFYHIILILAGISLGYVSVSPITADGCSLRYVTVCVKSAEDGYFIPDLFIDDFNFHENGTDLIPPNIEQLNICEPESVLVDIVLFLDLSTSMDDEIFDLMANLPTFVDGIGIMNYRIAIYIHNGCPAFGIRELVRTDFSDPSCAYDPSGPDFWATNLVDFTCLFEAGHTEFYVMSPTRGSGDEDQYGAMYEAATSLTFRDGARRVFVLFTDERPIYTDIICSPSWGPSDADLYDFIDTMQAYNINVLPVTPADGEFQYSLLHESPDRRFYTGYTRLADSTHGLWHDLYGPDFTALVENITRAITADSCCYNFRFNEQYYCSGINYIDCYVDSFGMDVNSYDAHCIPRNLWRVPSPDCGLFSSCEYQPISLFFFEENEFGLSEVYLEIEGITYDLDSSEITNYNDTLIVFQPAEPWENGQMVNFDLVYAVDDSGCIIYGEPCSVRIDIDPPVLDDHIPVDGAVIINETTEMYFITHDLLSGVNWSDINRDWIDLRTNGVLRSDWNYRVSGDTVFIEDIGFEDADSVHIVLHIPDSPDYDYCPPNIGYFEWFFRVLISVPSARIVLPQPGTISACVDQQIHMIIKDDDGINWNTVETRIKGQMFNWDSGNLSHLGDTLIFMPPDGFYDDHDTVLVELLAAEDIYGRELPEGLEWTFYMDMVPPFAEMLHPLENEMISINTPELEVSIFDIFSGLDPESVTFSFLGRLFDFDDLHFVPENQQGGYFYLDLEEHSIELNPGDTVSLIVHSCDTPDTCGPNCSDHIFSFNVEPEVACERWPNPFTPNGDGFNDFAIFNYPHMYVDDAVLKIFDKRKYLVFERKLDFVEHYNQYERRYWQGFDTKKEKITPGLYFYIILKDGEVLCEGTITLVR